MNRWFYGFLLILAAGALAFRLPQLDRRPMHTDESVHALKFKGLMEKGVYRYDPLEYHGPTLYYFTLPSVWLSGARNFAETTETDYRVVPAFFGAGLVLLLLLTRDALGRSATLWAAAFIAISPAMVFYSRYFIHEMPLVFFTFLAMAAGWRCWRKPHWGWALLAGFGLGMMYATKETFLFNLGAMGLAAVLSLLWRRKFEGFAIRFPAGLTHWHWIGALAVALAVGTVFFTSFFTNASGPRDSIETYQPWFSRAGGQSPHIHPWLYYLRLLAWSHPRGGPVWSEAIIMILAAIGACSVFMRKASPEADLGWGRFIALYTGILTLIYCLIPYKTPWCLLGFWHGMILMAGIGAAWVAGAAPGYAKVPVGIALAAALGQLGWQSYRTCYVFDSDPRNPYVYAHTLPDLVSLATKTINLSRAHPDGSKMMVMVAVKRGASSPGGDYWPLPWYLRSLKAGYWDDLPKEPIASLAPAVVIVSPFLAPAIEQKLGTNYQATGFYGHRPSVFLQMYVEKGLWSEYLKHPAPEDE